MYLKRAKQMDKDHTDELFHHAKRDLLQGKTYLQNLVNTDASMRSSELLPNSFLEKIIKLALWNSLCIAKIKMCKPEDLSSLNCTIDYGQSTNNMMLLNVAPKVVRNKGIEEEKKQ